MILSNGCWLLWPLSFLIWAGNKSQRLSNLEAWGLLKLLSVAKKNANVTHTHMLYSKRISEIGYYILKILPTSSKYWIYKKRHLEKASLKGITSVFTHLAMKMIAQHTSGKSNIEVFRAIFGGFLKWWYPTTMGFPTKNDHFGVFWGYHHLRKHPCVYIYIYKCGTPVVTGIWDGEELYRSNSVCQKIPKHIGW